MLMFQSFPFPSFLSLLIIIPLSTLFFLLEVQLRLRSKMWQYTFQAIAKSFKGVRAQWSTEILKLAMSGTPFGIYIQDNGRPILRTLHVANFEKKKTPPKNRPFTAGWFWAYKKSHSRICCSNMRETQRTQSAERWKGESCTPFCILLLWTLSIVPVFKIKHYVSETGSVSVLRW
jgi:hypothetical protein